MQIFGVFCEKKCRFSGYFQKKNADFQESKNLHLNFQIELRHNIFYKNTPLHFTYTITAFRPLSEKIIPRLAHTLYISCYNSVNKKTRYSLNRSKGEACRWKA